MKINIFSQRLRRLILPFSYCLLLCYAILEVYDLGGFSLESLIAFSLCCLLFIIFEILIKFRKIGALINAVIFYITYLILKRLISASPNFTEWFFNGGDSLVDSRNYGIITAIAFSFFFCTAGYCFVVVHYRMSMVMLLSIVPCVLYVKVDDNISSGYLIAIMAMNIAIMLYHRMESIEINGTVHGKKSRIGTVAILATLTLVIASAIPRPSQTKYYDTFRDLFMTQTGRSNSISQQFTRYSGNADFYRYIQNELLYEAYAKEVMYMRRQWFDYYDNELDLWTCKDFSDFETTTEFADRQEKLSYDKLLDALKAASELDEEFAKRHNIQKLLSYEGEPFDEQRSISLYGAIDDGAGYVDPVYFLTAVRTIDLRSQFRAHSVVLANGGIFLRYGSTNMGYTIQYYEEVNSSEKWIAAGGADILIDDFSKMIYDAMGLLSDENYEVCDAFRKEMIIARRHNYDEFTIPEGIVELAGEITQGLTYDYEKAAAIEAYFHDGSYVYDLEYVAPTSDIEYFLFDSKTGTCSDYATAYVLLAKAAGLTARYVEGFVTTPVSSDSNLYEIRTTGAHAFPEVYVAGMGWRIYEPTSLVYRGSGITGTVNTPTILGNLQVDYKILKTAILAMIMVIIAIVIVWISPALFELMFRIRITVTGNSKAVILIYNRLCKRAIKERSRELTPQLTAEYAKEIGADIDKLVDTFERACYSENGVQAITIEEKKIAQIKYKEFMKCFVKAKLNSKGRKKGNK